MSGTAGLIFFAKSKILTIVNGVNNQAKPIVNGPNLMRVFLAAIF